MKNLCHAQRHKCHRHTDGRLGNAPCSFRHIVPDKIAEKRKQGDKTPLDHHIDPQSTGKYAILCIPRRSAHHIRFSFLHSKGDRREGVRDQIDPQNMYGLKDRKAKQRRNKDCQNLRKVRGKQELDRFTDVVVNTSSLCYGCNDRRKVVIRQDHIRHGFRDIRAGDSHPDTDICLFDRRCIIHTVPGHGSHAVKGLPGFDDTYLVFRLHSGVHRIITDILRKGGIIDRIQLRPGNRFLSFREDPEFFCDGDRCILMIPGNHDRTDSGFAALSNRCLNLRPDRIDHARHTDPGHLPLTGIRFTFYRALIIYTLRCRKHTKCLIRHVLVFFEQELPLLLC